MFFLCEDLSPLYYMLNLIQIQRLLVFSRRILVIPIQWSQAVYW